VARQRVEQGGAVVAQRPGFEYLLHHRLAVLEHAKIERHGPRIDARYTGHIIRA
jgi:hypothetical protein